MSTYGAYRSGLTGCAVLEHRNCLPQPGRLQSGACASTSAATPRPRPHWTFSTAPQSPRQRLLRRMVAAARRRSDLDDEDRDQGARGSQKIDRGFHFSNRRGYYRLQLNDYEAEVRQEEAWKLLVPLLGGVVLATAVIGPLIIGVAFAAIAVGAALSAGALFTSLFLPFFLFIGMGALFFGGLTFSAFATLGTALLLPKLLGLAVVGGGLGLGALTVSLFLKPAAKKAKESYEEAPRNGDSGKRKPRPQQDPEIIEEAESEADPEVERQLREFDELLAGREEQRRRTDRFRTGGSR